VTPLHRPDSQSLKLFQLKRFSAC